jgi:TolA-binding protein
MSPNAFVTPVYLMKAAQLLETKKDFNKALDFYKEIQKEYPQSDEGRKIEKYIARAEAGLGK